MRRTCYALRAVDPGNTPTLPNVILWSVGESACLRCQVRPLRNEPRFVLPGGKSVFANEKAPLEDSSEGPRERKIGLLP